MSEKEKAQKKAVATAAAKSLDFKLPAEVQKDAIFDGLRKEPATQAYLISNTAKPLFSGFFVDKKGKRRGDLVNEAVRRFLDYLVRNGDFFDGVIRVMVDIVVKAVGEVRKILPKATTVRDWIRTLIPWIERALDLTFPVIKLAAKYFGRWLMRAVYTGVKAAALGPETAGVGSVAAIAETLAEGAVRDLDQFTDDVPVLLSLYKDKIMNALPIGDRYEDNREFEALFRGLGAFRSTAEGIPVFVLRNDLGMLTSDDGMHAAKRSCDPLVQALNVTERRMADSFGYEPVIAKSVT